MHSIVVDLSHDAPASTTDTRMNLRSTPELVDLKGRNVLRTGLNAGAAVEIICTDGQRHAGTLTDLPFYDSQAEIPRDKRVDIPERV